MVCSLFKYIKHVTCQSPIERHCSTLQVVAMKTVHNSMTEEQKTHQETISKQSFELANSRYNETLNVFYLRVGILRHLHKMTSSLLQQLPIDFQCRLYFIAFLPQQDNDHRTRSEAGDHQGTVEGFKCCSRGAGERDT